MNEEPKTNEDNWSVEPPKKDHSRLKTVLRVALIVAALGAVMVAGVVLFGKSIKQPLMGMVVVEPYGTPSHPEIAQTIKQGDIEASAEDYGQSISGAGYGDE